MSEQLFNNPNGRRGSAEVRLKMHEIYDLIRYRLAWVNGDFDPDAVCQNICVEIERKIGTYPNVAGIKVDDE